MSLLFNVKPFLPLIVLQGVKQKVHIHSIRTFIYVCKRNLAFFMISFAVYLKPDNSLILAISSLAGLYPGGGADPPSGSCGTPLMFGLKLGLVGQV
jgi:hypothetical protein